MMTHCDFLFQDEVPQTAVNVVLSWKSLSLEREAAIGPAKHDWCFTKDDVTYAISWLPSMFMCVQISSLSSII
jgi:hypothetical protein